MFPARAVLSVALSCAVAILLAAIVVQSRAASAQLVPILEGSWVSDVRPEDPAQPRNITFWTFTGDGSLISSNRDHPTRGPAHGTWIRTGDHEFAVTFLRLIFDDQGTFAGTQKLRGQITVNQNTDEFTSRSMSEIFDAQGNLLRTGATIGTAQRIKVEPLP